MICLLIYFKKLVLYNVFQDIFKIYKKVCAFFKMKYAASKKERKIFLCCTMQNIRRFSSE